MGDCQLSDKKSQYCKRTSFDQLFIAADASSAGGKTDERYNKKKMLNRQEFLQCIVKAACMKYVESGDIVDVSEALHRLLSADIEGRLDPKVFVEPNDFRKSHLYSEPVDKALRQHESSLRLIFDRLTKLKGQNAAAGIANKMVSFEVWKEFTRLFELCDVDITERHVTLAFLWGRMKVVDEQLERTRVKLTHMTFEDFLEGVCRLAAYKAFPTDDELAASEYASAGEYVYRLRGEAPEDYENMVKARARPWGAQPLLRLERSVEHMCSLLIVTAQQGNGEDASALDEKEAASFIPNAK